MMLRSQRCRSLPNTYPNPRQYFLAWSQLLPAAQGVSGAWEESAGGVWAMRAMLTVIGNIREVC